jgi:hypothetical protein
MELGGSQAATPPVVAFATAGRVLLGTDDGAWLEADAGGARVVHTSGPFAAYAGDADRLAVATFAGRLSLRRDGGWTELTLTSPVLALAVTRRGLALADLEGGLALLADGTRIPIQELTAPTPLVALHPLGDGLAALGLGGDLAVTSWPGAPGPLRAVDTAAIGRAHALFDGMAPDTALVAGGQGVAVLAGDRLTAVTQALPERVAAAAGFAGRGRACLCDDAGSAWIVDAHLDHATPVRLPGGRMIGVAAAGGDVVLGWSADGALYAIKPDGACHRLPGGDVVLALAEPRRPDAGIAIHWTASGGARVSRELVPWT